MGLNAQALVSLLLSKNPNIQNNPMAMNMINAIRNNDAQQGEMLANNLLQTYGVSKEEGIKQAEQFFSNMGR